MPYVAISHSSLLQKHTHTHTNWTMLDVWSVVHFDVPEDRTLMLFPCLHIVEFVCLKIFINFWVKTYHCFNLSHMSHYFIALLEFFFIWVILSFPFRWTGSIWKSPVFGWSQTQLPSVYYLHMLRLDLAFSWLFPCSREILRDFFFFFFLFQSLWFFFFSFHSYVFVCVCSWCLLDSNIIYLQVAAQHNTNFHVLAGSLHFSSIIYRDLLFFFPLIFGLWRLCVNLGTVVSRTWWLFFYFDSYWSSCIMPPWLPVTTIVYGLRLEWLLIHSSAAMPRSCRLQYLLLRDGGSGRKEASKERGRDAKDEFH